VASFGLKSVASFGTTQQQIFSDIGYYRGVLVALKHIRKEHIQLSRNVLLEFNEVCTGTLNTTRRGAYSIPKVPSCMGRGLAVPNNPGP